MALHNVHETPTRSSPATVHIEAIRSVGFTVLDSVIPPDRIDEVRGRVCTQAQLHRRASAPAGVAFAPSVINHDQCFAEYLAEPRLMQICRALLGHDFRISFTSAIVNELANPRGNWHADWPFNMDGAGHIPAPYPDAVFHLTTIWMLSPFSGDNGGTLIVPGSHRLPNNPTNQNGVDPGSALPEEINASGEAGDVLVMDSRLWHATAENHSTEPRVALAVRYAPWWLDLDVLMPGSDTRKAMCDEQGKCDNEVPAIRREVFEELPENIKPLYRHWVERPQA